MSTRWAYKDEATLQSGFPTLHRTPGELCPAGNLAANVHANVAIEAALTIRLVFHLPLRQNRGLPAFPGPDARGGDPCSGPHDSVPAAQDAR